MVMLHVFNELKLNFRAAHCNFHLRGEDSNQDEALVREFCKGNQIPFCQKDFEIDSEVDNTQLQARNLRYQWFQELLEEDEVLVLAHHLDDQMETVMLNLIRGTGIDGLTAMKTLTIQQGKAYFRPLLTVPKKEIVVYALNRLVPFREDASNASNDYSRNRIRNVIIPEMEKIKPQLHTTFKENIEEFQMMRRFLEKQVEGIVLEKRYGISFLNLNQLPQDEFLRLYFFRNYGFSRNDLSALMELENLQSGKVVHSPSHEILKDREGIYLRKIIRDQKELPTYEIKEPSESIFPWGNREISFSGKKADNQYPLKLRIWKSGDKIQLSNGTHKKVKDLLTDQKIPLWVKVVTPVLENNAGEIIAVPKIQEFGVVFLFD